MSGQLFRVDVTLSVQLTMSGASASDVIGRARDIVAARPGMRAGTIAAICAMPIPTGMLREANLAYWQESEAIEHGSPAQREQWERGELPTSELCDIARNVLFAPMRKFHRRSRMGVSSIKHPMDASGSWACAVDPESRHNPMAIPVTWASTPCLTPASWEFATLLKISSAAREIATHPWLDHLPDGSVAVHARSHTGTCQRCGGSASETSAMVSVPWAGRTLSREYAL